MIAEKKEKQMGVESARKSSLWDPSAHVLKPQPQPCPTEGKYLIVGWKSASLTSKKDLTNFLLEMIMLIVFSELGSHVRVSIEALANVQVFLLRTVSWPRWLRLMLPSGRVFAQNGKVRSDMRSEKERPLTGIHSRSHLPSRFAHGYETNQNCA